jgi:probable F420-dependent oxidoreductase
LSVAPYRNPFLLAKAAASLDIVSGGRFILGLGTGYLKTEFFALGVDFDERNAQLDETLEVLPLHWRGEPFSYDGRHFSARDVVARPRPIQNPIPIWIGGNAQVVRRRVADHAQGWMPMLGSGTRNQTTRTPAMESLDDVAAAMNEIRERGAARGEFDLLCGYGGRIEITDDPGGHRDAIAEMEKAGVTWVNIVGRTNDRDATLAFVDWFGANVIAP